MSTKDKNQKTPPAGTPPADGAPSATDVNAVAQDWSLKSPKYKVPTPEGLVIVTAEVLNNDPALLAMMVEKYPECFETLPAPAEPTEPTE